jgi:hypothetical protein
VGALPAVVLLLTLLSGIAAGTLALPPTPARACTVQDLDASSCEWGDLVVLHGAAVAAVGAYVCIVAEPCGAATVTLVAVSLPVAVPFALNYFGVLPFDQQLKLAALIQGGPAVVALLGAIPLQVKVAIVLGALAYRFGPDAVAAAITAASSALGAATGLWPFLVEEPEPGTAIPIDIPTGSSSPSTTVTVAPVPVETGEVSLGAGETHDGFPALPGGGIDTSFSPPPPVIVVPEIVIPEIVVPEIVIPEIVIPDIVLPDFSFAF